MQALGVKIDNAKGTKGYKKRFFTNFSAWFFARTERKLEQYCKIKDNKLSFWVNELMNFWTDEFLNWWVRELEGVMSSGVVGLSFVYKSVSGLVLHLSQFIEILKAETTS